MHKTGLILTAFAITCITATSALSGVKNPIITQKMVHTLYKNMEDALNNRSTHIDVIRTLHKQVKDDAAIKMTIKNPEMETAAHPVSVTLTKEDYINNFVQGTAHVMNYHATIESAAFKYDTATKTATNTERMIETGKILDPRTFDPSTAKAFIARTNCKTEFEHNGENIVVSEKICTTDISYTEDI